MFKDYPIQWFWTKLMVASKSINNIPNNYLSYARNLRIYDWGIWPRRWKLQLLNSAIWVKNRGVFILNDDLYQITNSHIYRINEQTWEQTQIVSLWYDSLCDVAVYEYNTDIYTSLWTLNISYNYSSITQKVQRIKYNANLQSLILENDTLWTIDVKPISISNSWHPYPSVKIFYSQTTNAQAVWTWIDAWDWYILKHWEYMTLADTYITVANETARFWLASQIPSASIYVWAKVYQTDNNTYYLISAILPIIPTPSHSPYYTIEFTTVQNYSWVIWFSVWYYTLTKNHKAIIVSDSQRMNVFDWTSIFIPSTTTTLTWRNVENFRGYNFYSVWNILYISVPITVSNPAWAYDFTWTWSQQIIYDSEISCLKATQNWIFIFTKSKIEFLSANSLQNVAWSATFISSPIWESSEPMNQFSACTDWNDIFYLTKSLQIQKVSASNWIVEVSARPVISIKEFLNTLSDTQNDCYAWYNENEKTLNWSVKQAWFWYNNYVIVYDKINDTWNIDVGKNYNYVVKKNNIYYWLSDVNSSIYIDWIGYNDAWVAIQSKLRTNNILLWQNQTMFWWFFTKWWILKDTILEYNINIDWDIVFNDTIDWATFPNEQDYTGEIWIEPVWIEPVWGKILWKQKKLSPFDKRADQGRIYRSGNRIQYEISSESTIQDYIIDIIWTTAEPSAFTDTQNKF